MHIQFKKDRLRLGPVCLGMLTLILMAMVCPGVSGSSSEAQAAEGDVPVSVGGDSLSIAISNSRINLAADPTVNDGIVKSSLDISAKTTNPTGYTLKISAPDTAMRSNDSSVNATIPTLSSATALADFPDNRWGYYVGTSEGTSNSQFEAFNTSGVTIDSTTTANDTIRSRRLTIVVKVGVSLPASTYTGNVAISVVANPPLIESIQTMQNMTSVFCDTLPEGAEGQLEDTRDGQLYYIGKMKDGRCWMLQNLALGNTTGVTSLSSSDSNVINNWTLPKAYTSAMSGDTGYYGTGVWSFKKSVLATPLLTRSCGNSGSISSPLSCISVGFVDVSNSTKFEPTFTAQEMSWNGANATSEDTLVAVNCTSWSGTGTSKTCTAGTYDAHYLVGNYYQWNTATAGTGGSIASRDASSSICPKGWKLPTNDTTGSFSELLSKYGIGSNLSGTVSGKVYNIAGEPLRLVRNGAVYPDNYINNAGQVGGYWLSRAYSNTEIAHYLSFTSSAVYSSDTYARYMGLSVRCVNDPSI